jgi:hypothetical protein
MAKRCLHARLRSFTFRSGEVMTSCPDCNFGQGHYDQSTPTGGKTYRRFRRTEPEKTEVVNDTFFVQRRMERIRQTKLELPVEESECTDTELEVSEPDEISGEQSEEIHQSCKSVKHSSRLMMNWKTKFQMQMTRSAQKI